MRDREKEQRPVTGRLDVRGESSLLERYFVLVPPV
jgi:hypothetical protein